MSPEADGDAGASHVDALRAERDELLRTLAKITQRNAVVSELNALAVAGAGPLELASPILELLTDELGASAAGYYHLSDSVLALCASAGSAARFVPDHVAPPVRAAPGPALMLVSRGSGLQGSTGPGDTEIIVYVAGRGETSAAILLRTAAPPNDIDRQFLYALVTCLSGALQLTEAASKLQALAWTDSLTGLPNQLQLKQHLERALDRSRRSLMPVTVFFLDLDGFKAVNDRLGHASGDALLQELATRLERVVRAGDMAGRLGGDEFLVVVESVVSEQVDVVRTRLARALNAEYDVDGHRLRITVSIGVAVSDADTTGPALIAAADQSMYERKKANAAAVRVSDDVATVIAGINPVQKLRDGASS